MLVVFHKDNGIDFNFKWLSYNKATDIFKYDPITQNNWVRSDTKVFKFSQNDYFKFKEIDRNIDNLIFFSDSLLGIIGLTKITQPNATYSVDLKPDDPLAINVFTQLEIDEYIIDRDALLAWQATNPPDNSTMPVTTTPFYDRLLNKITHRKATITTQEVTQIVTSIQGTLVDLNTEMQVAP